MAALSAYMTRAPARVVDEPPVETGLRLVPGAPKLVLLAVVVLVGVSVEADVLPGPAASLVGAGMLLIAIGLACRSAVAARRSGIESGPATWDAAALQQDNARLEAELRAMTCELRRSRVRVAIAAADERCRLERELHDRAQNRLVALQIRLGLARERAEESAPAVATLLAELGDQAEAVGEELRRIACGVYPPRLATHGLADALTAEARFCGVAVRVVAGRLGFSAPGVELAVYQCCLEAIQNAAKHAGRDVRVTVRLGRDGDDLTFSVQDDGRGFAPAATEGSGLAGMRDRIALLGGRLEVSSSAGRGTTVAAVVPWPAKTTNTTRSAPV
jgi:signal transduction histidine kinase